MLHEAPSKFVPAQVRDDDEGRRWAAKVIGNDVALGLTQVRGVWAASEVIYAHETAVNRAMEDGVGLANKDALIAAEDTWPGLKEARTAADNIGSLFIGAFEHTWRLPVRSVADIEAKVRLAIEHGGYDCHEYPVDEIIKQIADFFAKAARQ